MIERTVVVKNSMGLHLRPATMIARLAKKFNSNIKLKKGNKIVNANSCLFIVSLEAKSGEEIEIIVDGSDEEQAMESICNIISSSEKDLKDCI